MTEWKIERVRNACASCAEPFEDEQRIVSCIRFTEEELPERLDQCRPCFAKAPAEVFWETRWESPSEEKRKKIDFNQLLRLFEVWLERRPKGQDSLLYLIALLLVRKRFFRMLDLVNEGGEECLRLRRPGPEQEAFLVPAPLLSASALPALRERLEALLDGALDEDDLAAVSSDGAPSA